MIIQRTTSLATVLAQPLRVLCGNCHRAFVVLAERTYTASETGTSWFANADARRDRVLQKLLREQQKGLLDEAHGVCPHCYFPFPTKYSPGRAGAIATFLLFGLVGGFVGGWLLDSWLHLAFGVPVGMAVLGGLGVWVGLKADLESHPVPEGQRDDPMVMKDDEWEQFVKESETRHLEPAKSWWYGRLGRRTGEKEVFVPVAFEDLASMEAKPGG